MKIATRLKHQVDPAHLENVCVTPNKFCINMFTCQPVHVIKACTLGFIHESRSLFHLSLSLSLGTPVEVVSQPAARESGQIKPYYSQDGFTLRESI